VAYAAALPLWAHRLAVAWEGTSMSTNSYAAVMAERCRRSRLRARVLVGLAGALGAFALMVPSAIAADLGSADTAEAAGAASQARAVEVDLRSPDTQEAAPGTVDARHMALLNNGDQLATVNRIGLVQSPDRQDLAARPNVTLVQLPAVETVSVGSGMSAWAGAAIGVGSLLALVLALIGSLLLMNWRMLRPVPQS
jgi:hypothetical protein